MFSRTNLTLVVVMQVLMTPFHCLAYSSTLQKRTRWIKARFKTLCAQVWANSKWNWSITSKWSPIPQFSHSHLKTVSVTNQYCEGGQCSRAPGVMRGWWSQIQRESDGLLADCKGQVCLNLQDGYSSLSKVPNNLPAWTCIHELTKTKARNKLIDVKSKL